MKSLGHVMRENEWLTYFGYGGKDEDGLRLGDSSESFLLATDWVEKYMRRQDDINELRSSYELKHICEKMVGQYISNGVMIAAFLAHGYKCARIRASLNVELNVSEYAVTIARSISNGRKPAGFVYFVQAGDQDLFKIGRTNGLPEERLATLQVASPVPLSLHRCISIGAPRDLERALHQQFKPYRVSGEWFAITPEMIRDALP